jgi:hypothetical protein
LLLRRRSLDGDAVDRSLWPLVWAWTLLLAPESADAGGASFETVDATTARALLPFRSEMWDATLRFDGETGLLARFETHRADPVTGAPLRFGLDVRGHGTIDGHPVPRELHADWAGLPVLRLTIEEYELAGT